MELIKDGNLNFSLLVGEDMDGLTIKAINEFCLFMRKCTGKDQPTDTVYDEKKNYVCIGCNSRLVEDFVRLPREKFQDDTAYVLVKDNLVVLDSVNRGVLYSVYEFFERFFGVRFYAPELYKTPKCKNLTIDDQEILYTPPFAYREVYSGEFRWNREFATRVRSNAENSPYKTADLGGGALWALPNCHTTFKNLLNPEDERYGFKAHPEFFSYNKERNARIAKFSDDRNWGEGEVCWTNDEALSVMTERLKAWILSQPSKEIFSVSQNDWATHCECPNCERLAREHGENGRLRWSAPLVYGVNTIAEKIAAWQKTDERVKNRKIVIETFAYKYSTLPPVGMRVADNVMIRLCSHECCFNHAFDDESCPVNREFVQSVVGWERVADRIYIWDYGTNFYFDLAFNTILKNVQKNMQFFARHKIVGVFEQFDGDVHAGTYPLIRQYMFARLLWNPDIRYEDELREAFEFFYGRVGERLLQAEKLFWKVTDDCADFHPRLSYTIAKEQYPDDFLDEATRLYEQALSEAETAEIALRVRRDYVCLKFIKAYLRRATVSKEEMAALLDEFSYLGVTFSKLDLFKKHFFDGEKSDFFLEEIEIRNKKLDAERIRKIIEDRV